MTNGFRTDPETLEQVSKALRKAGDELGATPAGPQAVDAGASSGHFNRMISKLVRDADQLSTGLLAAADELATTRSAYLGSEQRGQRRF